MGKDDNSAGVDQTDIKGFDQLSDNDVISSLFETENEQDIQSAKDQAAIEEESKKTGAEDIIIPEKKEDKLDNTDTKDDSGKLVDKSDKKGEEEDDDIKLPGEETKKTNTKDDATGKSEDDGSWIAVAKELGYELPTDSFEDFKTVLTTEKEKIREQVKAELQTASKDEVIKKFPVEAQMIILALDSGLTMEQVTKPLQAIDELIVLSDADLVAKNLELEGMPKDMVEKEVLRMEEEGKLDVEAFHLRKFLETEKTNIKNKAVEDLTALKTKREEERKVLVEKDTNEIYAALKATPKLLESEIKEKHINYVMEKWKKGEYQELLNDPKVISQFLLQHEFGKQAASRLAEKKYEEGRGTIVNKLHNVPIKTKGSQGQPMTTISKEEAIGNFDILKDISPEDL